MGPFGGVRSWEETGFAKLGRSTASPTPTENRVLPFVFSLQEGGPVFSLLREAIDNEPGVPLATTPDPPTDTA